MSEHLSGPQAAHWYRALTFRERLDALRASHIPLSSNETGRRRLAQWRAQPPFDQEDYFARRLAVEGLTEAELLHLLSEPADALRQRLPGPPAWLTTLHEAYSAPQDQPLPPALEEAAATSFVALAAPLLRRTMALLQEAIADLQQTSTNVPFEPDTVASLLAASLPKQLRKLLNPTLVLELQVARMAGKLTAGSSEARFQQFIDALRHPGDALALLGEYPVLARLLVTFMNNWLETRVEFLQRLCHDAPALQQLTGGALGSLIALDDTAGDRHRQGRCVMIPHFSSGRRLVYKPKALDVDLHFHELLEWLNARCDVPPFRPLSLLARERYGWVAFVTAQPCANEAQLSRFYRRMGGYLALLYVLNGMDFHYDNIIADGEHPMLIDLEMLFQPQHFDPPATRYLDLVTEARNKSVMATLMLPVQVVNQPAHRQVDGSGIGGDGNQQRRNVLAVTGEGSDEMRFVRTTVTLPPKQNRPTLRGDAVNSADYIDDILRGFDKVYRCLQLHRDELLAPGGPIARFADDEIRILIRNTPGYALLARQSLQPDALRDALRQEQELERLWHDAILFPRLLQAVPHERESIQVGDVGLFTTRPDSEDCESEYGRLPNFFKKSGLAVVRARLRQLGARDYERQMRLMRTALAALAPTGGKRYWPSPRPISAAPAEAGAPALLEAAVAIADRLLEMALPDGGRVAWMGLDAVDHERWVLNYSATDLYQGAPGIALFLAYLATHSDQAVYRQTARAAVNTMLEELAYDEIGQIGVFQGWGSVIYTLAHVGVLWQEPALLARAAELVERIPPLLDGARSDLLGGSAGAIAALAALYQVQPTPRTLEAAISCGRHLLQQQDGAEQAGFAGGDAGAGWALLKLAEMSGVDAFAEAGHARLTRAHAAILAQAAPGDASWRNGAAGVGLASLQALRAGYPSTTRLLQPLLQCVATAGFGHNHSAGSGDIGGLEFLLQAEPLMGCEALLAEKSAAMLHSLRRDGPICGVPFAVPTPGLVNGLAGIGYGLLRLAFPEQTPSLLTPAAPLPAATAQAFPLPSSSFTQEKRAAAAS